MSALMNASVVPSYLVVVAFSTLFFALYASTNVAAFILGARIRGLFRSSFYTSDLRQTPVSRAQIIDSLLAIAIPAAFVIVLGEIAFAVVSQLFRTGASFFTVFRPELILYPRLPRIEAITSMKFNSAQVLFAASTLNSVRIVENALLLVVTVSAFASARRINSAIFRAVAATFVIGFINAVVGTFHTFLLLPIDLDFARRGFVIDSQVFVDLFVQAPLLLLAVVYVRSRFIAAPLAVEAEA